MPAKRYDYLDYQWFLIHLYPYPVVYRGYEPLLQCKAER